MRADIFVSSLSITGAAEPLPLPAKMEAENARRCEDAHKAAPIKKHE
jgi:hypothetical protein